MNEPNMVQQAFWAMYEDLAAAVDAEAERRGIDLYAEYADSDEGA